MRLIEAMKYGFAVYGLYSLVKKIHDAIPEDIQESKEALIVQEIRICGDTPSNTLRMYYNLQTTHLDNIRVSDICALVTATGGDSDVIEEMFNDTTKYGWTKEELDIQLETDEDGTVWLNLGRPFPLAE